MEELKELIRNLAFILLLATFLELLLPNKTMKGFVQVVMGLFVIAAILNPLTSFLNMDYENKVPAWVKVSSTDMPVLAAEGEKADTGKTAVREQYKKIVINQIKILISAIDGVESTEVDLELEKDSGGFTDYPQILEVNIYISQQIRKIPPVNPVIINENKSEMVFDSNIVKEIKKQVASFMQIPEEIIKVHEKI